MELVVFHEGSPTVARSISANPLPAMMASVFANAMTMNHPLDVVRSDGFDEAG
jgi:hypothetical protein